MTRKAGTLLKRFIPFYRPHIKMFIIDMSCALVMAGAELAFPMLVRLLMKNGLSESNFDINYVLVIGAALLGVKILDTLCNYVVASTGHMMGVKIEVDIRRSLFGKLQYMPHSYYDNNKVGHLMSRVTNDLFEITEFAHHCPEEFFIAGIKIIGAFILLSTIDLYLTLVIFLLLPLMLIYAIFYNRRMRAAFKRTREQIGEINAQLEDTLSGIRVVKSFANEPIEESKFAEGNRVFAVIKKKSYHYMGMFSSGVRFFDGLMYVAVVLVGSLFIVYRGLNVADLVTYLLFINTLLVSIRRLVEFTEQFQRGMTGFERYVEIMDTPVDIDDKPGAVELSQVRGEIKFADVSFSYGDEGQKVLEGVNLHIRPGENIALVGPSGGGKTTLVNLIPRFYNRSSGHITLDGIPLEDIQLRSLRKNVGIVQQDVYLFGGSVEENIAYGDPSATREQIVAAAKAAGAHDFIVKLSGGYDTYVGERGVKLSGGQKQRISIARVFLKNPPVLILDEATSALDNENEKIVQKSLENLARGRTTLTIAHRLTTIKNADRILVLTERGIEEQGSHDELLKDPDGIYRGMYKMYAE